MLLDRLDESGNPNAVVEAAQQLSCENGALVVVASREATVSQVGNVVRRYTARRTTTVRHKRHAPGSLSNPLLHGTSDIARTTSFWTHACGRH
jgi:hypothetical protein